MPDFAKGVAGVKKVQKEIKDVSALTNQIRTLNPEGDVTSCALTAGVVGNVINNKAMVAAPGFQAKKPAEKVAVIEALLANPKLVSVSMSPDHHFVVIPIDTDKVCILQGFQGVYNLIDWIKNRGEGVINKAEFLAAMKDLVTTDKAKVKAAALKLFSYRLAYEGEKAVGPAKTVEDEIKAYYAKADVILTMVGSKDL